jgi:hypothetical protein
LIITAGRALGVIGRLFAAAFAGGETDFFIAADTAMGVQPFENELGGRGT